jgi:hypothetical protein
MHKVKEITILGIVRSLPSCDGEPFGDPDALTVVSIKMLFV